MHQDRGATILTYTKVPHNEDRPDALQTIREVQNAKFALVSRREGSRHEARPDAFLMLRLKTGNFALVSGRQDDRPDGFPK